jgi:2-polyprenyl-3-methyl-5-hydroxy-6-metoxy-1,4-benzoquinol methylase
MCSGRSVWSVEVAQIEKVGREAMSTIIDKANIEFWNELCGSGLARHLGIKDHSRESITKFDQAYLKYYPYLLNHVKLADMFGKRVMEVGLGYGTLGQRIVEAGAEYVGLDIAEGPVKMMKHRLSIAGLHGTAIQGSVLDCPFRERFDWLVSIGCFHHTGDIQRCVDETFRVLKRGGQATIMVYNKFSFRQWLCWPAETLRSLLFDLRLQKNLQGVSEEMRKRYDSNVSGVSAPETQFSSIRELRRVFRRFTEVRFYKENCDDLTVPRVSLRHFGLSPTGHVLIPRSGLLSSVGKAFGTDIYIRVKK